MSFSMGIGGSGVIIAIVLIFFYLLYVVFPLFVPAGISSTSNYAIPAADAGPTLHLATEEQNEIGVRFTRQGHAVFFNMDNGQVRQDIRLPLSPGTSVQSFAHGFLARAAIAYGLDNGKALVARHMYAITYPDNKQVVTPRLEYPLGNKPIVIDPRQHPIMHIAVENNDEQTTVVGLTDDKRLLLVNMQKESGLFDEESEAAYETTTSVLPAVEQVQQLLIDPEQRLLYVAEAGGHISIFDISDKSTPRFMERKRLVPQDATLTTLHFLTGGISLLVGDSKGNISQWFPVRKEDSTVLTRIRNFSNLGNAITNLVAEQRRKGFISADDSGTIAVHHSTAQRTLLRSTISDVPIRQLAISPRANVLLAEDKNGRVHRMHIENEHPEVSWSVLWDQVWYESYPQPDYTWQSSSASNDFEPKYSLVPLTFGTLKAAFYAMLFAVPLAIMGAIYTAYFMAPVMRTYVKPTIEIMEALPTVILGFLAGLWLAPAIETNLTGIFALLIILPPGILLFAYLWSQTPARVRQLVPDGWQAALLIPVLIIFGLLSFQLSAPLELWLFDGDMLQWLGNNLGLEFDQRNSLVVGIAMGVAVIPTIFSIAEDAIFSVPKHLSFGSLALGATPWQTLVRVVILTASPGIFSAVMIGLGRAVGETMIVLMATGNTPVMDFSIFQGMRTLSANIAVEMPESEVDSTHYRILFLAALVLFMLTFTFNTLAEIIRQRLRLKYSSL